jgi:hypothetical protein
MSVWSAVVPPLSQPPVQELATIYPNARNGSMAVEMAPAGGDAGGGGGQPLRFRYKLADGEAGGVDEQDSSSLQTVLL